MGDVIYASDEHSLYGELYRILNELALETDLMEKGIIVGFHRIDNSNCKYVCQIQDWEGDDSPIEFERRIEKLVEGNILMIRLQGRGADCRFYVIAETIEEALGKITVFQIMES